MSHFIRGVLLSGVQSLFVRRHQSMDIRCDRNFHANQDSLVRMTSRNRLIVDRIQSRPLVLCQPLGILFQGRPRLVVVQMRPSHWIRNDVGFRKRDGVGGRLVVFLNIVRLRKDTGGMSSYARRKLLIGRDLTRNTVAVPPALQP